MKNRQCAKCAGRLFASLAVARRLSTCCNPVCAASGPRHKTVCYPMIVMKMQSHGGCRTKVYYGSQIDLLLLAVKY